MIEIKPIHTQDETLYAFVENLMLTAFPIEERRDTPQQREYTDHHPLFTSNIVLEDSIPVGMISYWNMGDFYYIEHFAIDPERRNGGLGKRVLEALFEQVSHPIVLEVEEPTDEWSKRRIGFYQRLGFTLHEKPYYQPPYHPNGEGLPLLLMTHGQLDMEQHFARVVRTLHREVYGQDE